jgi:hypothetical protein
MLQLVATDPSGGTTTVIGHTILAAQLPTVTISPLTPTVTTGGTQQFTYTLGANGKDQFGNALTGTWTWSVKANSATYTGAGGIIDPNSGLYYAPASNNGYTDTVQLTYDDSSGNNNTVYGTATVTVTGATIPNVTVVESGAAGESGTKAYFNFTRTGSTTNALTVNYTMSGSAIAGTDYQSLPGTITFAAGSATAQATLTPIHNGIITGYLYAILTLNAGTGYAVGSSSVQTSIHDIDLPTVTIAETTNGSEIGPVNGVFTLTETGNFRGPPPALTVNYNIGGTAVNGADYKWLSNSAVILPGQTTATITVPVVDIHDPAPTTSVVFTLATDSSYTVGSPSTATVTITDDPGIPGAPSNLIATPGTSTIGLVWTDPTNTSNVTGYHIYRSATNNGSNTSSWGTPYATVTGATATSYTDSSPGAGTAWYYFVSAYNVGDSTTGAGITCYVATVNAYEGFNYTLASTWSGGSTVPLGFTSDWTIANSSNASIVANLTYSSGTHALTTAGNALQLTAGDTASNTLTNAIGATGSTLWVSFELQGSGGTSPDMLRIGTGTTTGNVEFWQIGSSLGETIVTNTNHSLTPTSYVGAVNTTYFVVGEIQYNSTSPVITLWINPTPTNTSSPTGSVYSVTETVPSGDGTLTSTQAVTFLDNTSSNPAKFDELRLGSTYASVAPDPIVTGSSSKSRAHRTTPFLVKTATRKVSKATHSAKPAAAKLNRFYADLNAGAWQWTDATSDVDSLLLGMASKAGLFN